MSWTGIIALVTVLIGGGGLGAMLKVWLDHLRGKRKQTDDVALALVTKLETRVLKLEGDLQSDRVRCDDELRILRHRIGGWKQLFYSLMHLFDMPARQRSSALDAVRNQMATLEQAEAAETGAMLGARQADAAE